MKTKPKTKLVHEGDFVAEVPVELIETGEGWSPYLSVEDTQKLDEVREALVDWRDDPMLVSASQEESCIYRIPPGSSFQRIRYRNGELVD